MTTITDIPICRGGLGDITLCLDQFSNYENIIIHSHQTEDSINEFVEIFKSNYFPKTNIIYKSFNENINSNVMLTPKSRYSKTIMSHYSNHASDKLVPQAVLHPFGSAFANYYAEKVDRLYKFISLAGIKAFIDKYPEGVILGTNLELDFINSKFNTKFNYLPLKNQVDAALMSTKFIGIDSFFKTIRLSCGLPATVFVGNYDDPYRDHVFINPYKEEGLINEVRYSSMIDGIFMEAM